MATEPPGQKQPELHFGLDVSEAKAVLHKTSIELLIEWARNGIANFKIKIGDRNYEALMKGPVMFEVTDPTELKEYFRTIFLLCVENKGV